HRGWKIDRVLPPLFAGLEVVFGDLIILANQDLVVAGRIHADDVAGVLNTTDGDSLADQFALRVETEAILALLGHGEENGVAFGKAMTGENIRDILPLVRPC